MKNNLYISLFAASAMAFASCESDIDNYMVDDTVGFLNSGVVETEVYLGTDDVTDVYAIKSGKGFQSADVSIKVDAEVLEEYNALTSTKVKLAELPADCYSIAVSSLTLTNEDYRKPFVISWNRDRLEQELAENPNVVIPLRMAVSTTGDIAETRLTCMIKPSVVLPLVGLGKSGLFTADVPSRQSSAISDYYFKVNANFIAQRDINFVLEVDQSLIAEYNEEHGTEYELLPEEAYELDLEGGVIKKSLKSATFRLRFNRDYLVPDRGPSKFGTYMLPVRMKSLSSSNIDPENNYMLYAVSVEPLEVSKTNWSIVECNSDINDDPDATEAEKANNGPDALIDGTTSKWWRSIYRYAQPMPYYAVIDFGRKTVVARVGFQIPASSNRRYANSKTGHVELSIDGQTCTNVGSWESTSKSQLTVEFPVTVSEARYMKFVIDTPHDEVDSGAIKNPNATAIGEINVWGEAITWEDEE